MKELEYILVKAISKAKGEKKKETILKWFRKQGISIGEECNICCNIVTPESHLIKLGNNVTIAGNVEFITHDNSISKVIPSSTDLFGTITIGDNCFIGARSTILYGVSLANNIIVAAGSVVTNSFETERVIIGGNPAKVISTWDDFERKSHDYAWDLNNIGEKDRVEMQKANIKLIQR